MASDTVAPSQSPDIAKEYYRVPTDPSKRPIPGLTNKFRYLLLVLILLLLSSICSNAFAFNFVVICMGTNSSSQVGTRHDYTTNQQSILMWALSAGGILATFPFGYVYTRYGSRYMYAAAGMLSAVATALCPLATEWGMWWLFAVRFFLGASFSANFAMVGLFTSIWSPLASVGVYVSSLTSYTSVSSAATSFFGGFLCESSMGWPSVYYAHAIVCLTLSLLFCWLYRDSPGKSPHVTAKEVVIIERGKRKEEIEIDTYVPYRKIATSHTVIALWYNSFAGLGTAIFLISYTPIYLHDYQKFSVEQTGVISAAITTTMIPMRFLFGWLSDKIKFMSENKKLQLFNGIAQFIPAGGFIGLALAPSGWRAFAVSMMVLMNVTFAAQGGGFYKCVMLSCRQYSHVVVATIQFTKCFILFLAPLFYSLCIQDTANGAQWALAFYLMAGWLLSAGIWFFFVGTDEPLPFTKINRRGTSVAS